jgi:hypothetical protein
MARTATIDEARAAKAPALKVFGRLGVVASVGITRVDDGYGLKINLREAPGPGVALPTAVEGVPVRVEVVGTARSRQAAQAMSEHAELVSRQAGSRSRVRGVVGLGVPPVSTIMAEGASPARRAAAPRYATSRRVAVPRKEVDDKMKEHKARRARAE